MHSLLEWIEQRTGAFGVLKGFGGEEIPASTGWPQIFGSVALFLFLVQGLTGVLLASNHAATPGDAYDSLLYITRDIAGGSIVRGLHHWGATMMIIVVAMHATQVFLYGAYKRPREVTWVSGVLLLLLVLTFGLTGYLLPWDNRAYWGTVVTTQIAGQVPLIGQYMQQLLGVKDGVGVITFSRFYALHVLVLPTATLSLIGLHLLLIRKHGVTPAASDCLPKQTFYPGQVLRDTAAIFVAFVLLFLAALFLDAPLERMADPTDTAYAPRPEWYFLWLFQLLKFVRGPLEAVGSIVIPTGALAILVAVPFLDRGRARELRKRALAAGVIVFAAATWGLLTVAAVRSTPNGATSNPAAVVNNQKVLALPAQELAGFAYFRQENCERCHNLVDGEPKPGPTLATVETHASLDWMENHFRNPGNSNGPNSTSPLNPQQINALLTLVSKLNPDDALDLAGAPAAITDGASVYVRNMCWGCHRINGVGGGIGPSLNGLSARRSQDWVKRHFVAPKILSPGTVMPSYRFSPADQEAVVSYLFQLP